MATMIPRLVIGACLVLGVAVGAQRRPPNYSQDRMPVTSFSCRDKIIGGYYADPETDCQMFHVCVKVPGQGIQDYKFLCPNDTSFDQENQICDDWFNIDCEAATLYYSDNFDLYRIGSDFPGSDQSPRLPSVNINNAVSENDDDFYLQKSDRGESVGSDLLRGSHSSNFYSNRNRGREDEDDNKDYKKTTSKNGVRKLLTGKRPVSSTQAPVETSTTANQYQPRTHNNNYSNRVSQFRGHVRNQGTAAPVETTTIAARQTETYSRGQPFQRNYYSPTTPRAETTTVSQRTEYFRNYSPTTKHNYYENTHNFNAQTTAFAQTTRNYYNPRVSTTTTVQPSTVYTETTPASNERNSYYETQKLFQLNTAAFNQYDEPKDEFLKTAPSQNLGASAFNSLQNSLKSFNTSVSSSYNFIPPSQKQTTINYQTQTYFTPSTQAPNYYTQTTLKPFQQNNYYTTPNVQSTQQTYQQNYYNPSLQTTKKPAPQYTPTTIRPYQQSHTQATQTPFQQYTTTVKPYQPQQQYSNPSTQKPYQPQQQYSNPSTQKPYQPQQQYSNPSTQKPYQPEQQYNPTTQKPYQPQQQYNQATKKTTDKTFQKQYNVQQNFQTATAVQPQQSSSFQPQRNTAAPQAFQQQQFQSQRNPAKFQQASNYYNPSTQRSYQTTANAKIADTTEQPRPFTQVVNKPDKKEKEQYDYAYYDDGTVSEYDNIEPLEEFKKTKSKN